MEAHQGSKSFLQQLLDKLAAVRTIGESGGTTQAAQQEVLRQIAQCLKGGDPISGNGVTKSGEED